MNLFLYSYYTFFQFLASGILAAFKGRKPCQPSQTSAANVHASHRTGWHAFLALSFSGIDLSKPVSDADIAALTCGSRIRAPDLPRPRDERGRSHRLRQEVRKKLRVHPFAPNSGVKPELITFRKMTRTRPLARIAGIPTKRSDAPPPMGTMCCARRMFPHSVATRCCLHERSMGGLSDRMQHFNSGP